MPNRFSHRSESKEMMDSIEIPDEMLFTNLHELDILNRTMGGHAITLQGIKKLVRDKNKTYCITDLGCGSGDTLLFIVRWAKKNGYKVQLTGVDRNANAIAYLKNHCAGYPEIKGVVGDLHDFLKTENEVDILHCSLFCHHLKDDVLLDLLRWTNNHVRTGFIINDLRRNRLAYYSAWLFTRLLNGSRMAKNDGPVSVLRGFKYNELKTLLNLAEINMYSINRKRGFRFLVIGQTKADAKIKMNTPIGANS